MDAVKNTIDTSRYDKNCVIYHYYAKCIVASFLKIGLLCSTKYKTFILDKYCLSRILIYRLDSQKKKLSKTM